jgi:uncharacterized protein (TIGR03546 family)
MEGLMLKFLNLPVTMLNIVEGNISDREIAFGVCLGMFMGLIPLNGSMALLLAVLFFIFRVNRAATLLTLPVFKLLYFLGLRTVCDKLGFYILSDLDNLSGFWRAVTNLPVLALLDINYTLVAGGIALAAALSPIVYFISKKIAARVKASYAGKIKNTKFAVWASNVRKVHSISSVVHIENLTAIQDVDIKETFFGTLKNLILRRRVKTGGKSWVARRINLKGVTAVIAVLLILHFGVGLFVSPLAGAFIVQKLNETTDSRISVEKVSVWPLTLSASLKGVKVFDPNVSASRIASVGGLSFSLSPLGLLAGKIIIGSAHLSGAEFTPSGVPDQSFVPLEGLKPSVTIGQAKGPWDLASMLDTADKNKDIAGKVFQIIKGKFSKSSADKAKTKKKESKKITKTVENLELGQRVEFRRGTDNYILQIKNIGIDKALVELAGGDESLVIKNADIDIKGLAYDPVEGVDIRALSIRGALDKDGSTVGALDIGFEKKISESRQRARIDIILKDLDLDKTNFIYDKSLPVYAEKGTLYFRAVTTIDDSEMDSKIRLVLKGQRIVPRDPNKLAFGFMPMSIICEGLNGTDPLDLGFRVTGGVENPKLEGLQESIITLAKPYMNKVKEKILAEGAKFLGDIFKKNSGE